MASLTPDELSKKASDQARDGGGKFETELDAEQPGDVGLTRPVEYLQVDLPGLPPYPDLVPLPVGVGHTYGDDHPGVGYITFRFENDEHLTVWSDEDGHGNSIDNSDEELSFVKDDEERQLIEWASVAGDYVHGNVEAARANVFPYDFESVIAASVFTGEVPPSLKGVVFTGESADLSTLSDTEVEMLTAAIEARRRSS